MLWLPGSHKGILNYTVTYLNSDILTCVFLFYNKIIVAKHIVCYFFNKHIKLLQINYSSIVYITSGKPIFIYRFLHFVVMMCWKLTITINEICFFCVQNPIWVHLVGVSLSSFKRGNGSLLRVRFTNIILCMLSVPVTRKWLYLTVVEGREIRKVCKPVHHRHSGRKGILHLLYMFI